MTTDDPLACPGGMGMMGHFFTTRPTCDFCGRSRDQIQRDQFDVGVAETLKRLADVMDRATVVLEQLAHPVFVISAPDDENVDAS